MKDFRVRLCEHKVTGKHSYMIIVSNEDQSTDLHKLEREYDTHEEASEDRENVFKTIQEFMEDEYGEPLGGTFIPTARN